MYALVVWQGTEELCAHKSCPLGCFLHHAAHSAATELYIGELSYNLGHSLQFMPKLLVDHLQWLHLAQTTHEHNRTAVGTIPPHRPKSSGKTQWLSLCLPIEQTAAQLFPNLQQRDEEHSWQHRSQNTKRARENRTGLRAVQGDVHEFKEAEQEPCQCPLAEDS